MKVLWLTNNACSAIEILDPDNTRGGWLISLEKELSRQSEIELHVGFYSKSNRPPLKHGNTMFYPIFRKGNHSRFTRLIGRLFPAKNNDKQEIQLIKVLINEIQPDIIHVHGTEDNFGLIQNHTNIPVIVSIQGLLISCIEKFFSGIPLTVTGRYESFRDKLLFQTARSNFHKLKIKATREKIILENSKYIIGRTQWDKTITRVLSPLSTYFVGQEMLRPAFYTSSWHNSQNKSTYRLVSIISDPLYKGFEAIIKTATILRETLGFDFEWFVAGLHEKSYVVRLVQKWLSVEAGNLGIKLLGNQTEKQLTELMTNSDVFCQVSHIENSSNSLCEAMMIGMPCVATFVGGTSSILKDREEGILVPDGDPYALAGAIIELANDFEKAKGYASAARKSAILRHDKNSIVRKLIEVYLLLSSGNM